MKTSKEVSKIANSVELSRYIKKMGTTEVEKYGEKIIDGNYFGAYYYENSRVVEVPMGLTTAGKILTRLVWADEENFDEIWASYKNEKND